MPFILNEDSAIKAKLQGLTVTDETAPTGGRPVAVRFRLPETELGEANYPQIIIDPPEINKASDREHRGSTYLPYIPEDVTGPVTGFDRETGEPIPNWDPATADSVDSSPFWVPEYPIPFDFDYQITVETRKQTHLTQLMIRLAQVDMLPARFGYLEVAADNTVRSLFLTGGPAIVPQRDGDSKRLFRAVYRIRVASELSLYQYKQITGPDRVSSTHVQLSAIADQR